MAYERRAVPAQPADPPGVAAALAVYRLLLRALPQPFRSEYAGWMAQAFRDQCLAVQAAAGAPGLPALWAALWASSLLDWLKTMFTQHSMKGVTMTRSMFFRICGLCLMISALSVIAGLGVSALGSGAGGAYNYTGAVPGWLRLVENLAFPTFALLATLGAAGYLARFGSAGGRLGQAALGLGVLGGAIAFGCLALLAIVGESREPPGVWMTAMIGLMALFSALVIFGLAQRRPPVERRWMPVLAGAPFIAMMLLSALLEWQVPDLPVAALFSLTALGLFLLGRQMLQPAGTDAMPA